MHTLDQTVDTLRCPQTKQSLSLVSWREAESRVGDKLTHVRNGSYLYKQSATSPRVLITDNNQRAYVVIDGVPVLMAPEMLCEDGDYINVDTSDEKYEEAYQEMEFYNNVALEEASNIEESEAFSIVEPLLKIDGDEISFPKPRSKWLDATYECTAQWDAYNYISPIENKRVLQLGGKGAHAVKFLLGGASEGWLVTPMIGEARCAMALAEKSGVSDRLQCILAVAEELPLKENSFDVVFSGGCLHHTRTERSVPQISYILKESGKFAATDPWRAPLYSIGTSVFGKREPDVYCRPLTDERTRPLYKSFSSVNVVKHGTLTRYPLLVLAKMGITFSSDTVWRVSRIDDTISSFIPGFRGMGSSVACLARK